MACAEVAVAAGQLNAGEVGIEATARRQLLGVGRQLLRPRVIASQAMCHGIEDERSVLPDGLLGLHRETPGLFGIYPGALEVSQLQPGDQAQIEDLREAAELAALAQCCLGPVEEA